MQAVAEKNNPSFLSQPASSPRQPAPARPSFCLKLQRCSFSPCNFLVMCDTCARGVTKHGRGLAVLASARFLVSNACGRMKAVFMLCYLFIYSFIICRFYFHFVYLFVLFFKLPIQVFQYKRTPVHFIILCMCDVCTCVYIYM